MISYHRFVAVLAVTTLCAGCGAKEEDLAPDSEGASTTEPVSPISSLADGPVLSIAGEPLSAGPGLPPNTSGITPMDVVSGVPAPSGPSSGATAGSDLGETQEEGEEGAAAVNASIPPGLPILDFSGIVGHSNYRVESVTMGTAGPGEGPVGPDGKVIDPKTLIPSAGGEAPVGPDGRAMDPSSHGPSPRGAENPAQLPQLPSAEGTRLDPSEAPKFPLKRQKEPSSE